MKEHISMTIDKKIIDLLKKYARGERRSVSQVAELALEKYLKQFYQEDQSIVTSEASFNGSFSREETYDRDPG